VPQDSGSDAAIRRQSTESQANIIGHETLGEKSPINHSSIWKKIALLCSETELYYDKISWFTHTISSPRQKKFNRVLPQESKNWKVHAPKLVTINFENLLKVLPESVWKTQAQESWKRWLTDDSMYVALWRRLAKRDRKMYVSNISAKHAAEIIESGVVRKVPSSAADIYSKGSVKMWLLPEEDHDPARFRVIIEQPEITSILKRDGKRMLYELEGKTRFATIKNIVRMASGKRKFITMDYTCYFFEFPLSENVQPFFRVRFKNLAGTYVVTRLAMGISPAVPTAQKTSRAVIADAESYFVQIDNSFVFEPPPIYTLEEYLEVRRVRYSRRSS
jgi:hypothetical protein